MKALLLTFILSFTTLAHARSAEHLPVVFAPGLGMTGDIYRNYSPITAIFKARGYDLRIADTQEYGSIEAREKSFVASVRKLVPTGRFHIVSHSMGGLDARLALFKKEFGSRVVSLTQLSAPNRGTPLAAYVIQKIEEKHKKLDPNLMAAFHDLTTEHMKAFNAEVKDDPSVRYFSMGFRIPSPAAIYTLNPLSLIGKGVIENADEGDSDGFVSARSAKWGQSLGVMSADHFSEAMPIPFGARLRVEPIMSVVIDNLDKVESGR